MRIGIFFNINLRHECLNRDKRAAPYPIQFFYFLIFFAFFLPHTVFSLGLGDICVESYLNETLKARINLLSLHNVALEDIQIYLAPPAEYKKLELEHQAELSEIILAVKRYPHSRKYYIDVSSKNPITIPYLELLLDVRWPGGKLIRGYTVLLDPCDYDLEEEMHTSVVVEPDLFVHKSEPVFKRERSTTLMTNIVPVREQGKATLEKTPEMEGTTIEQKSTVTEKTIVPAKEVPSINLDKKASSQTSVRRKDLKSGEVPAPAADQDYLTVEKIVKQLLKARPKDPLVNKMTNLDQKTKEGMEKDITLQMAPSPDLEAVAGAIPVSDERGQLMAELAVSAEAAVAAQQSVQVLREEVTDLRLENNGLVAQLGQRDEEIKKMRSELDELITLTRQTQALLLKNQGKHLPVEGLSFKANSLPFIVFIMAILVFLMLYIPLIQSVAKNQGEERFPPKDADNPHND